MTARPVTGHVRRVKRKRSVKWYAAYRLPDGRQVKKMLGPEWKGPGRPREGYFTRKTAEAELRRLMTDAERGLSKLAWLKALNISVRNWKRTRSVMLNVLTMPRSTFQ